MQTFVPSSPSSPIKINALVLDNKRLFKQLVEAHQLLCTNTLACPVAREAWEKRKGLSWGTKLRDKKSMEVIAHKDAGKAHSNHPAAKMWVGHLPELRFYANTMLLECVARGYRTTYKLLAGAAWTNIPTWWGGPIHENHRRRLVAKDPDFYGKVWHDVKPCEENYWPTENGWEPA